MTKQLIILFVICIISNNPYSQDNRIEYIYNGYNFLALYDTVHYTTYFEISKNNNIIYQDTTYDRVIAIKEYDLEGDGKKEITVEFYSGGAHCCTDFTAAEIINDKYTVHDTLHLGDSGYEIKDLNNDGQPEISCVDVMFAYAFTNFSQSIFPVLIYQYNKGKFKDVTNKFPVLVESDMAGLKKDLNEEYLKKGYECPPKDAETFNTDAGAVQAYLAAIVEDYYNLGKIEKAYEYVDKVYKCKDKNKFIQRLKKEYNLK